MSVSPKSVPVIFWSGDIACPVPSVWPPSPWEHAWTFQFLFVIPRSLPPAQPWMAPLWQPAWCLRCWEGPHYQRMSFRRGKLNDRQERIFTSSYCTRHKDEPMHLGPILQGLQRLPSSGSHPPLPWESRLKSKSKWMNLMGRGWRSKPQLWFWLTGDLSFLCSQDQVSEIIWFGNGIKNG